MAIFVHCLEGEQLELESKIDKIYDNLSKTMIKIARKSEEEWCKINNSIQQLCNGGKKKWFKPVQTLECKQLVSRLKENEKDTESGSATRQLGNA